MTLPHTRLDPEGFYARLEVDPTASAESIVAAFRRHARVLHPDVPDTGDAEAFVALKQAYDVLSNAEQRETYDRTAREAASASLRFQAAAAQAAAMDAAERGWYDTEPADLNSGRGGRLIRPPRFTGLPTAVWVGMGAFLCLCVVEAVVHLRAQPSVVIDKIRPNAAVVEPLSPAAQRAVLYGPMPVRLAGTPNYYIVPAAGPAVLWRKEADRDAFYPAGQLPPFSSVQAVRLLRQNGLVEVRFNETTNGFVDAKHLMPGDAVAARHAYCGYNSGPVPYDGELLERRGAGGGTLRVENRAVQPAVVKLRDSGGLVALAVFLAPGGQVDVTGIANGTYRADFAIGELWSRACNSFAAGMQARRMTASLALTPRADLVIPPEGLPATDISDQAFEHE
jgi:hypothetical protein